MQSLEQRLSLNGRNRIPFEDEIEHRKRMNSFIKYGIPLAFLVAIVAFIAVIAVDYSEQLEIYGPPH